MIRLGILGSGNGSNFQAIQEAIEAGSLDAEIVMVLSDQSESGILKRAERAGVPYGVIDCGGSRLGFPLSAQQRTAERLLQAGVELVCLAGFMRLVKAPLLEAFPKKMINIHPSLLPAYPGLMAWEQCIEDGATESGCSIHYVDAGMDTGKVIAQSKVAVLSDDTPESLHRRIQQAEWVLYPQVIQALSQS